jgi:hypothetical protein
LDKLDHVRDGEAVREQDRFGAAVTTRGEQFERAAASGGSGPAAGLGHARSVALKRAGQPRISFASHLLPNPIFGKRRRREELISSA